MFSNFSGNSRYDENIVGINTEEGVEDSGIITVTVEDLYRKVRRRRSYTIRAKRTHD